MAKTNIFYRIPSQRGVGVASISGSQCTVDQLCNYITKTEGIDRHDFNIGLGTRVIRPTSCNLQSISLQNNSHVDILIPLLGGKGGFGSLLRAIGAQIEKTTNRDACRDLSGRRLRDIKREEELIKLLALQEKLKEEQKRRKKEKLEKLKKRTRESETSTSIQELINMFEDNAYNKRRLEIGDIINAAVEKGIINSKRSDDGEGKNSDEAKRLKVATSGEQTDESLNDLTERSEVKPETITQATSEKLEISKAAIKPKAKRKDLWLGLDGSDDDL